MCSCLCMAPVRRWPVCTDFVRKERRRRRCVNFCPSIMIIGTALMPELLRMDDKLHGHRMFSLTLRNVSRGSDILELPFASWAGYQGYKNIHCFPVFVTVANVILLFAQMFSILTQPVNLSSGSAKRWMFRKILGKLPVLGEKSSQEWNGNVPGAVTERPPELFNRVWLITWSWL